MPRETDFPDDLARRRVQLRNEALRKHAAAETARVAENRFIFFAIGLVIALVVFMWWGVR